MVALPCKGVVQGFIGGGPHEGATTLSSITFNAAKLLIYVVAVQGFEPRTQGL